ncbi:MAG: lipopolysaccharide biosynthesis protein [Bacteriovoracaceae bacterium]|nr:lipopolysaccharide biosynthesis protein [Bacteriovoracaceae bacterium]
MRNNFLYYTFTTLLTSLIPFIILPFLTRHLSPTDFGILALGQIFGSLTGGLSFQGLNVFFERNFFEWSKKNREKDLLFTYATYALVSSFAMTGVILFFKEFFSNLLFTNSQLYPVIIIFHLVSTFTNCRMLIMSYFKCKEDAKSFFYSQIFVTISVNTLIISWTILNNGKLYSYLYSHLIVNAFVALYLFAYLIKKGAKYDFNFIKKVLPVSLPLTPRIFIGTISSQVDKYMLGLLITLGAVGKYSIAQKFSFIIFVGGTTLGNIFTPVVYKKMFEGDSLKIRRQIGVFLTPFFFLAALATFILCLFSQEALFLATSQDYHDSYILIMVLAFYYLTLFFGKQNQLVFKKKSWIVLLLSLLQVLIGAPLNYYFITYWNEQGAALATLLTGLLVGGYTFYLSQKSYNILFEYKYILKLFGFIILSILIIVVFRNIDYKLLLLTKIVLMALFLFMFRKNIVDTIVIFKNKGSLSI